METKNTHIPNSEKPKKEKTVLTEELKQEMMKLREEGLTFGNIVQKLNLSYGFVQYHLRKLSQKKHSEEFQDMVSKISKLKDQRMRNKEIAATLELSLAKLFSYIQRAETLSRKRFAPREKIVAAFEAGKNFKEIAHEFGFDESTIRKALLNLGLRKPKSSIKKSN